MKPAHSRSALFAVLTAVVGWSAAPGDPVLSPSQGVVSWMYVREKGHSHIHNLPGPQAYALQESIPGEFLWYREKGKAYLIKDPGTLAKVRASSQASASMQAAGTGSARAPQPKPSPMDELVRDGSRKAILRGLVTPMPLVPQVP